MYNSISNTQPEKQKANRKLKHVQFLLSVYIVGVLFFLSFRVLLLLTELSQLENLPDKFSLLANSFLMGLRFDTVISCYILLLPLIVLSITSTIRYENKYIHKAILVYLSFFYSLAFFICAADIPYFNQFFKRLNVSVFNWVEDFGWVVRMIIEEKRYLVYLFVFIAYVVLFIYIIRKLEKKYLENSSYDNFKLTAKKYIPLNIFISLILILICFIGIRGRIEKKSPIKVGTAYFSNYAFPNLLALNPVFTFIRSIIDSYNEENAELNLMNNDEAIANVRMYFNITDTSYNSPIARAVKTEKVQTKANVILILMEAISANYMQRYGNEYQLTPFLDSIANQSYCFENTFTAGIHTMNGVYSTLYGFPALLKQHPLNV
ncbi:MAG: sulfatase-like hydrolase/transferase, partial [Ignavibacteria bacterium]|nr:sulfatase-like hydrolase/transferase [Ignavibacteria bacterium]